MSDLLALVVEDDYDIATIFAQALKAGGFKAQIAQSGEQALAYLADTVPDIVVLDMHLPEVSGLDLLRHLRAEVRFAHTRVLVATADPRIADAVEHSADLVLIKPITFSQMRDLAKRLRSAPAR